MSESNLDATQPTCSLSEQNQQPQSQYLVQLIVEVSKATKKRPRVHMLKL